MEVIWLRRMGDPKEIREIDVRRAKIRKSGSGRRGNGCRISILKPDPNYMVNAVICWGLRTLLFVCTGFVRLNRRHSDHGKNGQAKY